MNFKGLVPLYRWLFFSLLLAVLPLVEARQAFQNSETTTQYGYDELGLAAEYTATGALIQEYGYAPTAAWTVSYFGTSHLGTPEVAFDKRGTLTWQATAQAFGATRVSRLLIDNPLRFPGQYWDAETGLHYN